jgi:hypothetical protein
VCGYVGACECAEGLWDEVVAAAFATELTWGPRHNQKSGPVADERHTVTRDAWSGVSTLQLGPLKHITTAQELDDAFAKLPPTRTGEATQQLRRPDTSEVLRWFAQLTCAAAPFMVWQDTTFQVRSLHSLTFFRCAPQRKEDHLTTAIGAW